MRVKVKRIGDGLHPSEVVVEVETKSGMERLVVDKKVFQSNSLPIGYPLGELGEFTLVELPRETMSGKWRVWVNRSSVINDNARRAA